MTEGAEVVQAGVMRDAPRDGVVHVEASDRAERVMVTGLAECAPAEAATVVIPLQHVPLDVMGLFPAFSAPDAPL